MMKNERKMLNSQRTNPNPTIHYCVNCSKPCVNLDAINDDEGNKRVKKEEWSHCVYDLLLDFNKPDGTENEKISVEDALFTIYKLHLLNQVNLESSSSSSKNEFLLCEKCGDIMQTLYILLDEFNHMRSPNSFLTTKISQVDDLLDQVQDSLAQQSQNEDMDDTPIANDKEDTLNKINLSVKSTTFKSSTFDTKKRKNLSSSSNSGHTNDSSTNIGMTTITPVPVVELNFDDDDFNNGMDFIDESEDPFQLTIAEAVYEDPPHAMTSREQIQENESDQSSSYSEYTEKESSFNSTGQSSTQKRGPGRVAKIKVYENCPICSDGRVFDHPSELAQHLMLHHEDQKSKKIGFSCILCADSSFAMYTGLRIHVSGHAGDTQFGCPVPNCTRMFLTKQQAQVHSIRHCTREKMIEPASQEIPIKNCFTKVKITTAAAPLKKFNDLPGLGKAPRRTRTQLFTNCPICPDQPSFDQPSDLSNHFWELHRPPKSAKGACTLCNKKITPTNLRTHLRAHAGDHGFSCPFPQCGQRSFLTKQQRQCHFTRIHPDPNEMEDEQDNLLEDEFKNKSPFNDDDDDSHIASDIKIEV